uniref:Uncharacterized protein n=1 Tax=Anguilla anguilla TaxID=7936 RepID=A0A0E9WIF8_ANGAN
MISFSVFGLQTHSPLSDSPPQTLPHVTYDPHHATTANGKKKYNLNKTNI